MKSVLIAMIAAHVLSPPAQAEPKIHVFVRDQLRAQLTKTSQIESSGASWFPEIPHARHDVPVLTVMNAGRAVPVNGICLVSFVKPSVFSESMQRAFHPKVIGAIEPSEHDLGGLTMHVPKALLPGSGVWKFKKDRYKADEARLFVLAIDVSEFYGRPAVLFNVFRKDKELRLSAGRHLTFRRHYLHHYFTVTPVEIDATHRLVSLLNETAKSTHLTTFRGTYSAGGNDPLAHWDVFEHSPKYRRDRMTKIFNEIGLPTK